MARMVAWRWRGGDGAVGGAAEGIAEAKVDAVLAVVKKNEKRLDIRLEAEHVAVDGIADCGWRRFVCGGMASMVARACQARFFCEKKKKNEVDVLEEGSDSRECVARVVRVR